MRNDAPADSCAREDATHEAVDFCSKKKAEKDRREEKRKKNSKIGRAMQTQINRKNIIIEKEETAEAGRTGREERERSWTGHARDRERVGKVEHTPHTRFCVGRCMRFVSRRAALLRGGSSKEDWTKERVCERREAHRREPRRVSSRRSSDAPEVENLSDSLLSTRICASRELLGRFIVPVRANSGRSLAQKITAKSRSSFREKVWVVGEFRHTFRHTSLDSLPRSSLRSPTSARKISNGYLQRMERYLILQFT